MNRNTIIAIVVIIIILLGGWFWYSQSQSSAPAQQAAGPSQTAGINGSPNQGNLGQPDNGSGQVQQPGADGAEGSIIGANLALGTDSNAKLGKYLIGYTGMTVYTYSKDSVGTTTCYGQCATNWPPYIVGAEDNLTQLQSGVSGQVGTITRADGTLQMTYNGMPLYFYVGDKTSSDVSGNGLGGVWHVAKP